jgi:hypothetical protein
VQHKLSQAEHLAIKNKKFLIQEIAAEKEETAGRLERLNLLQSSPLDLHTFHCEELSKPMYKEIGK